MKEYTVRACIASVDMTITADNISEAKEIAKGVLQDNWEIISISEYENKER